MAKSKQKKKGKAGKTIAGAGILAVIAALLGFDPFGWGVGPGNGFGTGNGESDTRQEQQAEDNAENSTRQETPKATETPEPTQAEEQKEPETVQLTEVAVRVKGDKVVYNGTEGTAQVAADTLASEFADAKDSILVKVALEEAVYDTVEALKVALESKGIKYEIAE